MARNTNVQQGIGLDNPQMPLFSPTPAQEEHEKLRDLDEFGSNISEIPTWRELNDEPEFKVGIVINSTAIYDHQLSAISRPASMCLLESLVLLYPQEGEKKDAKCIDRWMEKNDIQDRKKDVILRWGQVGFKELLQSDIDAVYIIVPPGSEREYILSALQAGKHVLLNDPLSTSLEEFKEQQEVAKQHGKFVQFSTMFIHQYRVQRFIDRIIFDESFGRINSINSYLRLCYDDVQKVGVQLPLTKNDGCIRVLGRFCVLVSTLFFSRVGSFAHSAKVNSIKRGRNGEILSAQCIVKFTEGRYLNFDVGYTQSATRQNLELQATSRYASMRDFVIEHPDGLASYRVYDKAPSPSGKLEVVGGESIDVSGGPGQDTMMWRTFVRLSDSLDKKGGWHQSGKSAECRELANVSLQLKRTLIALMKSLENSFEEVIIDDIRY